MAPENLTIGSTDASSGKIPWLRAQYHEQRRDQESDGHGTSEIEEEELSSEGGNDVVYRLSTIREEVGTVFSYDFDGGEDAVYVVVEEETSSMDALIWTVNNAVTNKSSTVVFLVNVFPQTRLIPSPLGMLPVNQVNPEQKENYMIQQRTKRREFLQKFINLCSASQVKVDTLLVESDAKTKAIINLILVLHIKKIVLGATKSTIRKIKSKKGNTMANQILQNAPEFCDVKIIYEGKEMPELAWDLLSLSSLASTSSRSSNISSKHFQGDRQTRGGHTTCGCFRL